MYTQPPELKRKTEKEGKKEGEKKGGKKTKEINQPWFVTPIQSC